MEQKLISLFIEKPFSKTTVIKDHIDDLKDYINDGWVIKSVSPAGDLCVTLLLEKAIKPKAKGSHVGFGQSVLK